MNKTHAAADSDVDDFTAQPSPAVTNPTSWEMVAILADHVGANALTPWMVTFWDVEDDLSATKRTVLTATLRGSDTDRGVSIYDIEYEEHYSIRVDDIERASPLLDDDGEILDKELSAIELYNRMRLDDLLLCEEFEPAEEPDEE